MQDRRGDMTMDDESVFAAASAAYLIEVNRSSRTAVIQQPGALDNESDE